MAEKDIILVDEQDNEIGGGEKLKVHQEGKLHRSFSIFIFNSNKQLLLQKRAKSKYHSGGLWSNTCCSHQRPNQDLAEEAKRRLFEEMGMECDLKEVFSFTYKANLGQMIENEFDHVFIGKFDGNPQPNKNEVEDWKWVNPKQLGMEIEKHPDNYTIWFKLIFDRVFKYVGY